MQALLEENLARFRRACDLSQEQLAEKSGVSIATISLIERGLGVHPRPATVDKLARGLGISTAALLGLQSVSAEQTMAALDDLRRAITASAEIPGLADFPEPEEVATSESIGEAAHDAWKAYVDGRHPDLLYALPLLLADARRLVHSTTGDAQAAARRHLSTAYRLGAGLAGRFQLLDLAWTASEKALKEARECDSPRIEEAISLRYLVWTLIRQGRAKAAENVAVKAAEGIEPTVWARTDDRASGHAGVFGNLMFNAASAARLSGSVSRAEDHLRLTQAIALLSRRDTASEEAIFGPRTAAFQRVNHELRCGDPETALRLGEQIPRVDGTVPLFWEAGNLLHMAWAAVQLGKDRKALGLIAEAKELAPAWAGQQPLGTAIMRTLVDRAGRRRGPAFAALAAHFGVAARADR